MKEQRQEGAPRKLLGPLRLKLQVAAASALVLGAGALLSPRAAPTTVPVSQERAAPLLEAEVQRREPVRLFRPIQEVARRVVAHSVTVPPAELSPTRIIPDFAPVSDTHAAPSGFGVIVDADGAVLTHASALAGRSRLQIQTADGGSVDAEIVAHEASTGLALLRTGIRAPAGAPLTTARPEAGALAATSARWNGTSIVAPVFVTSAGADSYTIDAHGAALGGMPLYNLDGEAFAIAAGPVRGRAFPILEAVDRLQRRAAAGHGLDASIGVSFQTGTPRAPGTPAGALVTGLIDPGPAADAGMRPGDLIVAIDGAAIDSLGAAQSAIAGLVPGGRTTVGIVRNSRPLTLTVPVASAFELAPRFAPEAPGPRPR